MPLTEYNDTAIHEAGHCILAYLNSDIFEIRFVTINPSLSKFLDASSLGGLNGRFKKVGEIFTFSEHDQMILTCLAGMAADDVNHADCQLTEALYDNSIFAQKLTSNKYSGDSQLLYPHLQRVVPQLSVMQRTYTISCQKLLHELFTHGQIKNILVDLRNEIIGTGEQTLSGERINHFLDNTYLREWKEANWVAILGERITKYQQS